jgi:hypothetical protein
MDFRFSLQRILLTLIAVSCLPVSASADQHPFDITDSTTRTVVIWFDNNSDDPSSVGNDLEYAYDGIWTVSQDGATGTIVVDKDEVIAVFPRTGISGTPAGVWVDQTTTIEIATGKIISMSQTGYLFILGLGNQYFSYDLNTTRIDSVTGNLYTDTGFAPFLVPPETFTAWCTNENPGQIGQFFCPDFQNNYNGPAPFAYNSNTGRFNAIGPVNLNDVVYVYATFGDVQLFEEEGYVPPPPPMPALSGPMVVALVLALLATGATCTWREAGTV